MHVPIEPPSGSVWSIPTPLVVLVVRMWPAVVLVAWMWPAVVLVVRMWPAVVLVARMWAAVVLVVRMWPAVVLVGTASTPLGRVMMVAVVLQLQQRARCATVWCMRFWTAMSRATSAPQFDWDSLLAVARWLYGAWLMLLLLLSLSCHCMHGIRVFLLGTEGQGSASLMLSPAPPPLFPHVRVPPSCAHDAPRGHCATVGPCPGIGNAQGGKAAANPAPSCVARQG